DVLAEDVGHPQVGLAVMQRHADGLYESSHQFSRQHLPENGCGRGFSPIPTAVIMPPRSVPGVTLRPPTIVACHCPFGRPLGIPRRDGHEIPSHLFVTLSQMVAPLPRLADNRKRPIHEIIAPRPEVLCNPPGKRHRPGSARRCACTRPPAAPCGPWQSFRARPRPRPGRRRASARRRARRGPPPPAVFPRTTGCSPARLLPAGRRSTTSDRT